MTGEVMMAAGRWAAGRWRMDLLARVTGGPGRVITHELTGDSPRSYTGRMNGRLAVVVALALSFLAPRASWAQAADRLESAAIAFEEILQVPDNTIPTDLLRKAACLVLVPGMKKGAFIVGANYGRGFVLCRKDGGRWSAPAGVRVEGGSVGFQIGGSETDVFMLVMNERGAEKLLSSRFTLGGDAAVAAGPVGRQTTAQTDAAMRAEILSWSRSRGVFAGVSLQGATLRDDEAANQEMYGRAYKNREIVRGKVEAPASAERLMTLLAKHPAGG
jgi:lipid-binding SYLF domain-containing protein